MIINLDTSSNITLYEQITTYIKNQILNGSLLAGENLPSIRNLAKDSNVSIITIKRAYDDLENLGFIKAIPSKGYFVSSNNIENLRDIAISKLETDVDKTIIKAKALGFSKSEFLNMIEILYDF